MEERIVIRIDTPPIPHISGFHHYKRVAAYARVSTSSEEQLNSVEAQKTYYIDYINKNKGWIFAGLYTDDGISGLSYQKRDGFNRMINDAFEGKIDLIITKSISRFARNTVDTLTHIRKLKEKGVAVYFEKEDINTLDAKGEFMITLLSSMAQEESRSISENVKWGLRKRMADGKYYVPYKRFLGYKKGKNSLEIVEKEAETIRYIYHLFLAGKTENFIAKKLRNLSIPTPSGQGGWDPSVINSILKNEKYCGNALLQKTFVVNYLTKREKKNRGELPKYFVKNGHKPIIDPVVWNEVQSIKQKRDRTYSGCSIYSHKLKCGVCGRFYLRRVRRDQTYRDDPAIYYHCRGKYDPECRCKNTVIYEAELDEIFSSAIIQLYKRHERRVLSSIRKAIKECMPIDRQRIVLRNVSIISNLGNEHSLLVSAFTKEILVTKATASPDNTILFELRNGECIQARSERKTPKRALGFHKSFNLAKQF